MKREAAKRAFERLTSQAKGIEFPPHDPDGFPTPINTSAWTGWWSDALNLLRSACGKKSEHYLLFKRWMGGNLSSREIVVGLIEIFNAAKKAFDNGEIDNPDRPTPKTVFEWLAESADDENTKTNHRAAAVVAGTGIELAVRFYAEANEADRPKDPMNVRLAALKEKGLISEDETSSLQAAWKIRNKATHDLKAVITAQDGDSVQKNLERFIKNHLDNSE